MQTLRISISIAVILRVPRPLRCCMMPARMASLSLCCFLQPPPSKSAAESPNVAATLLIRGSFLFLLNQLAETCLLTGSPTVYSPQSEDWQYASRETQSHLQFPALGIYAGRGCA